MFFFIFFDISSLLLRYITPAIPRSSRLDLSKNILKNIDSYLNFRTLDSHMYFVGVGTPTPQRVAVVYVCVCASKSATIKLPYNGIMMMEVKRIHSHFCKSPYIHSNKTR